jgi:hypothetical protein
MVKMVDRNDQLSGRVQLVRCELDGGMMAKSMGLWNMMGRRSGLPLRPEVPDFL